MSVLVRLRVELGDSPGCLAKVAAVIGRNGGNITGVDVQNGWADRAIDELTVEFGDDVDLSEVRAQIEGAAGARVVSHQQASRVDLLATVIRDLAESLGDPPDFRLERLRRGLAVVCGTPAVWFSTRAVAADSEVGRLALASPGTACVGRGGPELPHPGDTIPGESSLLAIALEGEGSAPVLLIARGVAQTFTTTETERVEALVSFHARLGRRLFSEMDAPIP